MIKDLSPLALLALLFSPPQPAGLRTCNAAAFASFKKVPFSPFLNPAEGATEPNEAAYAVTGEDSSYYSHIIGELLKNR